MTTIRTTKLFKHRGGQAVCLPEGFRIPGKKARLRRVGRGVLLEPIDGPFDTAAWFAKLDDYLDEPFLPKGGISPSCPPPRRVFE